jgi:glycosyltransferase involved in cell wall biosynthesis
MPGLGKGGKEMKISLAITTYLRYDLTVESFKHVINDDRVSDILVLDDASTDGSFEKLVKHFSGHPKVKVTRQAQNRGMSISKRDAIALADGPWVIIFDSDNKLGSDYLDAICTQWMLSGELRPDTIYLPVQAAPRFNYEKFSGLTITKENVNDYMHDAMFRCALNTCNCLVNQNFYLKTFKPDLSIGCADTINHIYNHLSANGKLYFVTGMKYFHLVGPQSGFLENVDYNMKKAKEIENKIMAL